MTGAGLAVISTTGLSAAILGWYVLSGRSVAQFRWARLQWPLFADILRVGAVASVTTSQTIFTVALTTALVGAAAGPGAIAGYGTGGRLEFLLVPLVFGLGAPLVALVGTNIGAGQTARALRIAMTGAAVAFGLTETLGLVAAVWPQAWLGLFGDDPTMLATGTVYLQIVGPAYGFFGLGLSLYFASQGAGRLLWPLTAGLLRMLVAVGGGWTALYLTGSLGWEFAALALGLIVYGLIMITAVGSGAWFRAKRPVAVMGGTR
jgi:Na+-driven multidrug efflux pump